MYSSFIFDYEYVLYLFSICILFFFKQSTAYEMRISDWSSDVCSSDLNDITEYRWVSTLDGRTTSQCRSLDGKVFTIGKGPRPPIHMNCRSTTVAIIPGLENLSDILTRASQDGQVKGSLTYYEWLKTQRSEEHTSELQSQMRITYAVFCLKQ